MVNGISPGAVASSDDTQFSRPYVEWGPIFAGAVVAAAIGLALTTFGSAIGLASTSPYPWSGVSGKAIAIAAGLYAVWTAASAAIAGGYLAGRLRHRTFDSTQHESEVRNGAHGLVVWAVAALIAGTLASFAAGSATRGTWMSSGTSDTPEMAGRYADTMLRSDRNPPNDLARRQAVQLLEKAATGRDLPADDRAYLSRITATQTGVPAAEADKRIDATVTALRDDVNSARRLAVLLGFLTAASLAISAAAAWWGATLGGKHRDEGTHVAFLNVR